MRSVAFLVNDISAIGGSTKVTVQLANALVQHRHVKIISLFKSNENISLPISKDVELEILFNKRVKIFEVETYIKMLKSFNLIPILKLMITLGQLLLSYPLLRKKLDNYLKNVDTVIIPEIYGLLFINYKRNKKVIVQLHTNFSNIINNPLNCFTLDKFQDKIDQLVVLTNDDEQKFKLYGFKEVKRIYNPLAKTPVNSIRTFNNHFLYVGRLDYVKGIDYLMDIFKMLALQHDVHLDICGDGEMREEVESYIKEHDLSERVHLHGMISDLTPYFLRAVALISPSRREGLPLVFLESFSHQVPVVSFKSFESIEDIIIKDKNGYVVQVGEIKEAVSKLEYLLLNKEINQQMGQEAVKMLNDFKLETIINEWKSII